MRPTTSPLTHSQLINALNCRPALLHHNKAPLLHCFRSRSRAPNHESSKHFGNGFVTESNKTGPVKMDFIVEFIQVGTEKKFGNDVVFDPGLRHGNSAIEHLTGFAPTNSFIELQVRGRKTTCPSPCTPGKQ